MQVRVSVQTSLLPLTTLRHLVEARGQTLYEFYYILFYLLIVNVCNHIYCSQYPHTLLQVIC